MEKLRYREVKYAAQGYRAIIISGTLWVLNPPYVVSKSTTLIITQAPSKVVAGTRVIGAIQ